jgi:transposase
MEERWVRTRRRELTEWLRKYEGARVVMEAGTHSPWVSRLAKQLGHEVIVANPSELYGRKRRKRRNDKLDAEKLARSGRVDPALLYPIQHRGESAQVDLAVLRSRDTLVRVRTQLISHVRGTVKSVGERLPKCSPDMFGKRMGEAIPEGLRPALAAVVEQIALLTKQIQAYDAALEKKAEQSYPETQCLQQVRGVGVLTAMCYVLVLEDPKRFPRRREVGSHLGLVSRLDETGEFRPQLRITKAGDELLRRLLVQAAHYILGPFGPDTDLRRWGLKLMERGGKNAKKRAIVAVARKLAVLLHRLWETGEAYVPLYNEQQLSRAA